MEQKPDKKEELMLANNVLKLAADLLKVSLVHQVSTFINSKTFPLFFRNWKVHSKYQDFLLIPISIT